MKLSDIEDALKGNFVWAKSDADTKIHQTNPEVEGSPDTALIVFCGLAEMYGYDGKEIARHLSIEVDEYYRLNNLYRKKMKAAHERMDRNKWDIEINDLVQKVYIKSKLVQNKLRIYNAPFIKLEELPNY